MTTLLVDADIVAFTAAARQESWSEFGRAVTGTTLAAACDVDEMIEGWQAKFGADSVLMALSTRADNFRSTVLPTYKLNRAGKEDRRPIMLPDVKAYISEEYNSYLWDGLEGDDVLGILQTHPTFVDDDTIVISDDKDMRTFTGKMYAPCRDAVGVIEVTQLQADQFLCWQTITGDSTDGYTGAVGVGKASLFAQEVLVCDREELWGIVLEAYGSVGLTEADAIIQAQCAKILTHEHFNVDTGEVTLWQPENLMT